MKAFFQLNKQLNSYVAEHTHKWKTEKNLYWYLNINKSHQHILKQPETDCEKNIVFGYCWKGTTGVKKEKDYICKFSLKELEITKRIGIYIYQFLCFWGVCFLKEDLHRDCILDRVS